MRRQDSKNMFPMSPNSMASQSVNLFSCARVCVYTFITIRSKAHSEGDIQIDSQLYFSSVPRNRSSRLSHLQSLHLLLLSPSNRTREAGTVNTILSFLRSQLALLLQVAVRSDSCRGFLLWLALFSHPIFNASRCIYVFKQQQEGCNTLIAY